MTSLRPDPIVALADQCVQCGLCLPHCPTYTLTAVETESPRGRIVLARALALDRLTDASSAIDALDHCLGCRACESVCPAQVDYGRLLLEVRELTRSRRKAPWRQRLLEWLTRRPLRIDTALRAARWLRIGSAALRRWLPARTATPPAPGRYPASAPTRGRVLLFDGCVARQLDGAAHQAAITVLNRLGWEVEVIRTGCCGALHAHGGNATASRALQQELRRCIGDSGVDRVVLCSSGCFEAVHASSPVPTAELMDFIAGDGNLAALRWRPASASAGVAIHTPCTQRNVVRASDAAARALRHIPGLPITGDAPAGCCGAAGSHMLLQPERAAALRQPLLDWARASLQPTLCTSNIGCRLHLQQAVTTGSPALRLAHPVELLAAHLDPMP